MRNMKKIEFEKFLSIVSNDLYSFAYILIPDDLQASQLVVDSIQSLIISKRHTIDELFVDKKNSDHSLELLQIKRILMGNVYHLAKRRYQQIKLSIENDDIDAFYSLEVDEKSILFLKDKLKYSIEEISIVTEKTIQEVQSYLFASRAKMESFLSEERA